MPSHVPLASEFGKKVGNLKIATGRGTPPHVNDPRALARKFLGKQFKTDVDDARLRRQKSLYLV